MFLLRNRIPLIRYFSEVARLNNSLIPISQKSADFPKFELDFESIPSYTLGNYSEKMDEVLRGYLDSIRFIAGGRYNTAFFDTIDVYSFMEHVPLTHAADIKQLSEYEFKITAFDPTNAPTIEIALKKSAYSLEVVRDFENISVVLTVDKEASKAAAEKLFDEAKEKIAEIVNQANLRFANNKQAADNIKITGIRAVQDIEKLHNFKLAELDNKV